MLKKMAGAIILAADGDDVGIEGRAKCKLLLGETEPLPVSG